MVPGSSHTRVETPSKCSCPTLVPLSPTARCEPRIRRRGSMADLSVKNIGIGLASSLLAGAISVTAATSVGASALRSDSSAHAYVYTETDQTGANSVLAFRAAGGGLTSIGSFATGGDGTGAALGSQGALTLADGGRALLAVNAGSNTVSYFRILSNGDLRLVDAVPSGGADPVSVTAHGRWVQVLNAGSNTIGGLELTGGALVPSTHPPVSLSSEQRRPSKSASLLREHKSSSPRR